MRNRTYFIRQCLLFMVICLALTLIPPHSTTVNAADADNLLVYTAKGFGKATTTFLYDSNTDTRTPLISEDGPLWAVFSTSGVLAYSAGTQGHIYVLNTTAPRRSPVDITPNDVTDPSPLGWSPDGRYLAFATHKRIYIWDGVSSLDITPLELVALTGRYEAAWSKSGQLAFAFDYRHTYPSERDFSKIFVWNRRSTFELLHNLLSYEYAPAWSGDEQLAFLTEQGGSIDIYVWDGISFKDGRPNPSTMLNVAPEITAYYSFPIWTNANQLSFISQTEDDTDAQIYLWDGKKATNISQNPTMNNGSQSWNSKGQWAFATFFSPGDWVYVRDAQNKTILKVEGKSPTWGPNDDLLFCTKRGSYWVLSLWDGRAVKQIVSGNEIFAGWRGGANISCYFG